MSLLEKFSGAFSTLMNDESMTAGKAMLADKRSREAVIEEFENNVINSIQKSYEKRRLQKQDMELRWRLNIDYYNGNQFSYIDYATHDVREMPEYTSWEERNVFNEIAANIETRLAFLARRKNIMRNRPATSSAEDRTSARIGNRVLSSTRSTLQMSDKQQDANLLAAIMGSCIWKTVWDVSKGRVVGYKTIELEDDEADNLALEEYEKELMGESVNFVTMPIREGDVNTTIHSPFEVYPENISKPLRENRRVMHVVLMSPDELFSKWGKVEEGTTLETYKIIESDRRTYGGAISGRTFGSSIAVCQIENSVRVYEEWELPSPKYPNGRLIICTDENLLYYGKLPDALGEKGEYILPFDVQQSLRTDGFFGKSLVERLIPVQNKYNSVKNRKHDYVNRITMGVLMAEEGSVVNEQEILEDGLQPGAMIVIRQGTTREPKFLEPNSLPSAIENEEADLLNSFNRLSGVSQLAQQSTTPSNIQSGVALSALAEQDDTRIGLEAENIKKCLISIGRKWLILYRNHVKYPRMVKEIGKSDAFELSEFKGNDLTSFDVFIEAEAESADTLAQRRQKVIELLNSGLFNDPTTGNITNEGRAKVFEMLEMGNWEDFVDADDAQQRRAERENNLMAIGNTANIREFDDDVIHISRHHKFMTMPEYEEACLERPEIDAMFLEHIDKHLHNLSIKSSTGVTDGVSQGGMIPNGDIRMQQQGSFTEGQQ